MSRGCPIRCTVQYYILSCSLLKQHCEKMYSSVQCSSTFSFLALGADVPYVSNLYSTDKALLAVPESDVVAAGKFEFLGRRHATQRGLGASGAAMEGCGAGGAPLFRRYSGYPIPCSFTCPLYRHVLAAIPCFGTASASCNKNDEDL